MAIYNQDVFPACVVRWDTEQKAMRINLGDCGTCKMYFYTPYDAKEFLDYIKAELVEYETGKGKIIDTSKERT